MRCAHALRAWLWRLLLSGSARAGNGANFVLYDHHMAKKGETEINVYNDISSIGSGEEDYAAQLLEIEHGVTDYWTTSLYFEGVHIEGDEYEFGGWRFENRLRLFERSHHSEPGALRRIRGSQIGAPLSADGHGAHRQPSKRGRKARRRQGRRPRRRPSTRSRPGSSSATISPIASTSPSTGSTRPTSSPASGSSATPRVSTTSSTRPANRRRRRHLILHRPAAGTWRS